MHEHLLILVTQTKVNNLSICTSIANVHLSVYLFSIYILQFSKRCVITKSIVWKYVGFIKAKDGPATKTNLDMTKTIYKLCQKSNSNKVDNLLINRCLYLILFSVNFFHKQHIPIIIESWIGDSHSIITINRLFFF